MSHLIPCQRLSVLASRPRGGSGVRLVKYKSWSLSTASLIGGASIGFSDWVVAGIPAFRRGSRRLRHAAGDTAQLRQIQAARGWYAIQEEAAEKRGAA
jgi:hypothetical protein